MMAYEDEDLGTLPERENGTILLRIVSSSNFLWGLGQAMSAVD
jgi:hypothetical protein